MLFMLKRTAKLANKPMGWEKFRAAINKQGVAIIHYAPDMDWSSNKDIHYGVSIINLDHVAKNNTWQVTDVVSEQYGRQWKLPVKIKELVRGCIGKRYVAGHISQDIALNRFSGLNGADINKPFISTINLAAELLPNLKRDSLEELDKAINLSGISLPGFAEQMQQLAQPHNISLEYALTTAKLFLYLTWAINEKILDEPLLAPVALPKQHKPTPR